MNNKTIRKYFLVALGFLLFVLFIWFRFVRKRVPRKLPFTLLVISFLIIMCFTVLYIYLIYRLFKPSTKLGKNLKEFHEFLMKPLIEFDHFLEQYLFPKNIYILLYNKINNVKILYIVMDIIPRLCLSIALLVDVFFLFKFQYIYKILLVRLIPLITRYFFYSLDKIKNAWILDLASKIDSISTPFVIGVLEDDPDDDDDGADFVNAMMVLPLDKFVSYITRCRVCEEEDPEYRIHHTDEFYEKYMKEFNLKELESKHYANMKNTSRISIEKIIRLSVFIKQYQACYMINKSVRNTKAFIYLVFLCCWSYVLYVSIPKVLWMTGLNSLLTTLIDMEDPFSGVKMLEELIQYI